MKNIINDEPLNNQLSYLKLVGYNSAVISIRNMNPK